MAALATGVAGVALTALARHFAAVDPIASVRARGVMAEYLVANYTITHDAEYEAYPPGDRTDPAADGVRGQCRSGLLSIGAERSARMREAIFAT